jgi:hypothetical protein
VIVAMAFTLFIVPVAYRMFSGAATSPRATSRRLEKELDEQPLGVAGGSGAQPQLTDP